MIKGLEQCTMILICCGVNMQERAEAQVHRQVQSYRGASVTADAIDGRHRL